MTTFMFVAMIVGAVLGLIVNHPVMNLPVFTGFTNAKLGTMFPILFVTVAAALFPVSTVWCLPAPPPRPLPMRRIC